ncbi:hypothetical protein LTR37_004252 [Vermiconidia calcicola]|uniref:Uncharacterized protein n=1 Tax=Vermiconidia calcicola TaxID=1690605 RepID=A0ACC3NNG1_9PEZI|nr:hypothetical protein LTR37_004252 [Vermiconidia calcicola]
MSVFSVEPKEGGAATTQALDDICKVFGINLKDEEKEDYRKLLAVFDESAQELMAMPDYIPQVDLERFPRNDVHQMPKERNTHRAWAWRCSIKDTQQNDGLLAGKTVVLKDMISVKDVPMLMGTEFVSGFVPNMDATVTTRILEAGGHLLGKAVCENLCHSGTSHSAPTGVVENPYFAGNDNIDDRSFPAPTPDKISKYYTTLKDSQRPQDLTGLKIGIIKESLKVPVLDERVKSLFQNAVKGFEKAGATVAEISVPLHKKGPTIWTGVSKIGGYLTKLYGAPGHRSHNMHELNSLILEALHCQSGWDNAYSASKNIYLNGVWAEQRHPALLAKAMNLSRQLRDSYDTALNQYDVLITPTLPYVATSHPEPGAPPLEQIKKQVGLTSNICQFNLTGHPALTLPMGMLTPREGPAAGDESVKLPAGLQIIGKWWDEETVYRAAYAWELGHEWKKIGMDS